MFKGRTHPRIPGRFLARIISAHDPLQAELAPVVNVSLHGARLATVRKWACDSQVVVKFMSGELRPKSARVVYCEAVSNKGFAVGLEFLGPWHR